MITSDAFQNAQSKEQQIDSQSWASNKHCPFPAQNLAPGELIHSLLLRRCLLSGHPGWRTHITNIISRSGAWLDIPRIPFHARQSYTKIPADIKRRWLREGAAGGHGQCQTADGLLSWKIDYVFRLGSWSSPKCRTIGIPAAQIKYCPQCFRDQIQHAGFVWFRHWWYSDTICLIHDQELVSNYCTHCPPPAEISDWILSLMQGACLGCRQKIWDGNPLDSSHDPNGQLFFEEEAREKDIRDGPTPAPCYLWAVVKKVFLPFIRRLENNTHAITIEDRELLTIYNLIKSDQGLIESITISAGRRIFLALSRHPSRRLHEALASIQEIVSADKFRKIFRHTGKAGVDLLVYKNRHCETCQMAQDQCYISPRPGYTKHDIMQVCADN